MPQTSNAQRFLLDFTRRVWSTLSALLGENPRHYPKVFFLHFEKCGGSSVVHAFREQLENFAYHDFIRHQSLSEEESLTAARHLDEPVFEYRERLLHYFLSNKGLRFVRGHFQIRPEVLESYRDTWQFATLLREPVARWLSHYFYNRYKSEEHGAITMSIDDYLETTRAQALGQDYIDLLTGAGDYHEEEPLAEPSEEQIEKAKGVIDRFDVVGTLERINEFEHEVRETLGWPVRIGHKNKSPASEERREKEVSTTIRRKIEEICAPNRELYEHVVQR